VLWLDAYGQSCRTLFTTAAALIAMLGNAFDNPSRQAAEALAQPRCLIVDEIGYVLIDRQGADLRNGLLKR